MSSKFLRKHNGTLYTWIYTDFDYISSEYFNTMMLNSLGNVGFDLFGCLHEIVEFGAVKDLQSIFYSTELDEDLVQVFLQLGKFVLFDDKS
jgi:hypothetical protein